jgi:hypothetical protein
VSQAVARVVPLDGLNDHAQFLVSNRHMKVLVEPQEVTMGGHKFARVDGAFFERGIPFAVRDHRGRVLGRF